MTLQEATDFLYEMSDDELDDDDDVFNEDSDEIMSIIEHVESVMVECGDDDSTCMLLNIIT